MNSANMPKEKKEMKQNKMAHKNNNVSQMLDIRGWFEKSQELLKFILFILRAKTYRLS